MFKRKRKILAKLLSNNYGGSGSLLDSSPFYAQLISSLILNRGTGTPTFTRASTAYIDDFESLLKQVPSGAARFKGARFVRNLVQTSSLRPSTTQNTTVVSSSIAAPDGALVAHQLQLTGVAKVYWAVTGSRSTGTSVGSLWIQGVGGSVGKTVALYSFDGVTETGNDLVTLSTSWTRVSDSVSKGGALSRWGVTTQGGVATLTIGDSFNICYGQAEDTDGQSNQNPSEYVSVGVLSAPYHGAGIDGAKWFNTENGNTVASNVVTEATGTTIPPTTTLGYLAEGARTNLLLQSQTLGSSYTARAGAGAIVADQYIAPDGTTTMEKFPVSAGNSLHYWGTTISISASEHTYSIYVRYIAGQQWVWLGVDDGVTLFGASFDVQNGVVGAKHTSATSTINATGVANVYRISIAMTTAATAAGQFYLAAQSSDSATIQTWNAAGTEIIGAWGAQLEAASFASTYIPTTTTAVARNADVDAYPTANHITAAAGSVYFKFTPTTTPSNAGTVFFWGTYVDASNYTAVLHDGTNLIMRKRISAVNYDATIANTYVAGTTYEVWGSWGASGVCIKLDGVIGYMESDTASAQIGTSMQWGADGNSLQQPFASIKEARTWTRQVFTDTVDYITFNGDQWIDNAVDQNALIVR